MRHDAAVNMHTEKGSTTHFDTFTSNQLRFRGYVQRAKHEVPNQKHLAITLSQILIQYIYSLFSSFNLPKRMLSFSSGSIGIQPDLMQAKISLFAVIK